MQVALTRLDEFSVITLNRPEALNALNFDILRELSVALDEVQSADSRALFITGAGGKAFCAGADIKELMGRSLKQQRDGTALGQSVFCKIENLPVPSIAVIDGYAFGGGMEMSLACTFRIATPMSVLALPEIKLGLIPGYGGTQRLPRLIGQARALEMIMTGRRVTATEAQAIGLINRIASSNPMEEALKFARIFSGHSLLALSFAREAVQRSFETSLEQGLRTEADLITLAFQTRDAAEGMQAFIEKRTPRFIDQ